MSWEDVQPRSGGAGAGFITLKDGETKKIHVIDDEPHTFHSVFFNQIKKSAVIDPDNNPIKGMKGFDVRKRHAINVYDYDDQQIKILAGSNELFNQLKGIHEEWQGFETLDLKISRTGTGFDTKYQLVPTPKCMWDPSLIEGQDVHDLTVAFAPTPEDKIQAMVEGRDPAAEFDPSKLEDEVTPDEDEVVPEAEEVEPEPEPAPRPPARPAPKPAAVAPQAAMGRSELVMKINSLIKNKLRYKKPGAWKMDLQKYGGKDKQSLSQLGQDALIKLLAFVKTVK